MRESTIEKYLCKLIKEKKGLAMKLVSPGLAGVPDRIVLLPGGRLFFVELKAPGKEPRPLQKYTHSILKELGFKVFVISSKDEVKDFIDEVVSYGV